MSKLNFKPIKVGRYLLLERIATGGMAEVYRAKSSGAGGFEKQIAVKLILPNYASNEDFRRMFEDEARLCSGLNHANIVQVYDFIKADETYLLAMEYVSGKNLRQFINKARKLGIKLPIELSVYLISEACKGLEYAHNKRDDLTGKNLNIIHRDMSPQNIMVSYQGAIKIVDFGIAKAKGRVDQTRSGVIKGKFGYMSPEQANGESISKASDIFSTTIILYELLTDSRLFAADNDILTLKRIQECIVKRPSLLNPAIPKELEKIILKGLSKDLSLRYQSAGDLQKKLQTFLNKYKPDFSADDLAKTVAQVFSTEINYEQKRIEQAYKQSIPFSSGQESKKQDADEESDESDTVSEHELNTQDILLEEEEASKTLASYKVDELEEEKTVAGSSMSSHEEEDDQEEKEHSFQPLIADLPTQVGVQSPDTEHSFQILEEEVPSKETPQGFTPEEEDKTLASIKHEITDVSSVSELVSLGPSEAENQEHEEPSQLPSLTFSEVSRADSSDGSSNTQSNFSKSTEVEIKTESEDPTNPSVASLKEAPKPSQEIHPELSISLAIDRKSLEKERSQSRARLQKSHEDGPSFQDHPEEESSSYHSNMSDNNSISYRRDEDLKIKYQQFEDNIEELPTFREERSFSFLKFIFFVGLIVGGSFIFKPEIFQGGMKHLRAISSGKTEIPKEESGEQPPLDISPGSKFDSSSVEKNYAGILCNLRVDTDPRQAEIYIGSQKKGVSPEVLSVPCDKPVEITLTKEGYEKVKKQVVVKEKNQSFYYTLNRIPFGKLEITTSLNTNVYVNGRFVVATEANKPVILPLRANRNHRIKFKNSTLNIETTKDYYIQENSISRSKIILQDK